MLDYGSVEALAAVARSGSFEGAARALHVTPSAVSQRIKLLEERVGKLLIVRGQPCRPTDVGAALCRHAEQVALMEQELRQRLPALALKDEHTRERPTLTIAANADSVATWFMPALTRFAHGHAVLVDLVMDDQDHAESLLRAGQVQGVISSLPKPIQGCRVARLGRMRYRAVCSPRFHAEHFAKGVTRAALAATPALFFNRKDSLQNDYARKLARADVNLPAHWLPSSHAFVEACLGGMGWSMNVESLVAARIKRGELVELVPGRPLDLMLYWHSWRLASPVFAELTKVIVEEGRRQLL